MTTRDAPSPPAGHDPQVGELFPNVAAGGLAGPALADSATRGPVPSAVSMAPGPAAGPAPAAVPAAKNSGLPPFTQQELWQVMARQAALYTGMDSTSLPVEAAAELMEAVLFCAGAAWAEAPADTRLPLADWLLAGQRVLYRRVQAARRLQKAAEAATLPLENPVYAGQLAETAAFFKWYDLRFMAQAVPCTIDYPLALPVDEALRGVDYITEYLRRRLWEDEFCARFPIQRVRLVLGRFSPAWRELPLNLFEPVFASALGGALLGLEDPAPGRTPEEGAALYALLAGEGPEKLRQRLARAAARLCGALRIWGTAPRRYYADCALALAPRVAAADAAGMAQIFW